MMFIALVTNANDGAEAAAAAGVLGLSILDIFIISGVAGFALYWFVIRKKKEEPPEVKKLTVV